MNLSFVDKRYSGSAFELSDGSVLLQRRDKDLRIANPGLVSFFGGTALAGESPDDCLAREIHEELGFHVDWRSTRRACEMCKIDATGALVLMTVYTSSQVDLHHLGALEVMEGSAFIHWPGTSTDNALSPACKLFFDNRGRWSPAPFR